MYYFAPGNPSGCALNTDCSSQVGDACCRFDWSLVCQCVQGVRSDPPQATNTFVSSDLMSGSEQGCMGTATLGILLFGGAGVRDVSLRLWVLVYKVYHFSGPLAESPLLDKAFWAIVWQGICFSPDIML